MAEELADVKRPALPLPPDRLPISVPTGLLDSGKTTRLSRVQPGHTHTTVARLLTRAGASLDASGETPRSVSLALLAPTYELGLEASLVSNRTSSTS